MPLKDLSYIKTKINDGAQVDKYKKQIKDGEKIKPIQLLLPISGKEFSLQDGHHRLVAFRESKVEMIPVQVLHVDKNLKLTDITSKYK